MNESFYDSINQLPGSFTVPVNYGISEQELLLRQMRYEAAMSEIKFRLAVIGGTILATLPFAIPAGSAGIQETCQSPDKLPAVVCEANQNAREHAADLYRRIVGIPEPPGPYGDWR